MCSSVIIKKIFFVFVFLFLIEISGVFALNNLINIEKPNKVSEFGTIEIDITTNPIPVNVTQQLILKTDLDDVFNARFTPPSIFLFNGVSNTKLLIDITRTTPPGELSFNIFADDRSPVVISLNIDRIFDGEVVDDDIEREIIAKTGDDVDGGNILFRNIGNVDFDITTEVSGNASDFIFVPTRRSVFVDSMTTFPIRVQPSNNQKLGTYNFTIEFIVEGDVKHRVDGEIIVEDGIPPRLRSIEFEHDRSSVKNFIYVEATDNIGVDRVVLRYDNDEFKFEKKDSENFILEHTFTRLSRYLLEICAYDEDENDVCVEFNKTFARVDFIELVEQFELKFPSVKSGRHSRQHIFNLTNDAQNIAISLSNLRYTDITPQDLTIRLIDGDGAVRRFRSVNDEVVVEKSGKIFLEILSDNIGEVRGEINFMLPNFMVEIEPIDFRVQFKDYDVPQPFKTEWFGRNIDCDVIDTGNLETSHYECVLDMDISISPENLPIPTTIVDKEQQKVIHQQEVDKYKQSRNIYRVVTGLMIGLLVIIIGVFYFMIFVYPYFRIPFNVNDKEKK